MTPDVMVSMVGSARETSTRPASAAAIFDGIRTGRWAEPVAAIRQAYAEAVVNGDNPKAAVAELKQALPGILWSGTFRRRANDALEQHSGLLCADLDGLTSERIGELIDALRNDPHVAGGFVSPTGTGIKVLMRVPPQDNDLGHKLAFAAVKARFAQAYDIEVDQACKDVARLCFVSHDPGAWWNPEAEELPLLSGTSSEPEPEPAPEAGPDAGVVILPSGNVSFTESARTIFGRIAPTHSMFWRGGALVEPIDVAGVASLSVVKLESFRSRVERLGNVFAWRSGANGEPVLKIARMSRDDAAAIMGTLEAREMLPAIATVLRCPIMVENPPGQVAVLGKGYHTDNGGTLIVDGVVPEEVSVEEAAERLRWLVDEFDFASPGDHSRALAALVTPALRMGGHLRGPLPVDVAEADFSQAGKGYRHNLICSLYREGAYFVTARQGGVGSVDESFDSALMAGRPFVSLDNFRGCLDSQHLEAFITCPTLFPARIPYHGEVMVDPKRFLLQLTSNGLTATPDLANRASICRIRKRPGFKYRKTLEELERRQPEFLGAVFAIVAAWIAAGKPRTDETRHDFREWTQSLDWIVQELLGAAPLMVGHQTAQARVSNPALAWLRLVAIAIQAEGGLDREYLASDLVETCELHTIEIPGKPKDEDRAKRQVGSLLKKAFGAAPEIEVDTFTVTRGTRLHQRAEGGGFELKTYKFTVRSNPQQVQQGGNSRVEIPVFSEGVGPLTAVAAPYCGTDKGVEP